MGGRRRGRRRMDKKVEKRKKGEIKKRLER